MDLCLTTTSVDKSTVDVALPRLELVLRKFGFRSDRYSDEEQRMELREMQVRAARNWRAFMQGDTDERSGVPIARPYRWTRFSGEIELLDGQHPMAVLTVPYVSEKAYVAATFGKSAFEEVQRGGANAAADFAALCRLLAHCVVPAAFAVRRFDDEADLRQPLAVEDVLAWLEAPSLEVIRRGRFRFIGIREELANRGVAQMNWSSQIHVFSDGYLYYDGILDP